MYVLFKRNIREFYVVVVQTTAKKFTKQWELHAELLLSLLNT